MSGGWPLTRGSGDDPALAVPEGRDAPAAARLEVLRPGSGVLHTRGAPALALSLRHAELLLLLAEHPGQVLERETILDRVWGYSFDTTSNSLDVYIGYLRRKTEAGGLPRMIHTVRGVGFVLRSDEP